MLARIKMSASVRPECTGSMLAKIKMSASACPECTGVMLANIKMSASGRPECTGSMLARIKMSADGRPECTDSMFTKEQADLDCPEISGSRKPGLATSLPGTSGPTRRPHGSWLSRSLTGRHSYTRVRAAGICLKRRLFAVAEPAVAASWARRTTPAGRPLGNASPAGGPPVSRAPALPCCSPARERRS